MPNTTVPAAATGLPTDTTYRPDVLLRRPAAIPSKPVERAGNSKAMRAVRDEVRFRARLSGDTMAPTLADLIEREQLRSRIEAAVARLIDALDAIDGDADLEPVLGAPEINAHCRATCRGPDGRWMSARSTQKRWAKGTTDDREEADEDGSDLDEGEHDSSDLEPSLAAPEAVDQTRWAQGNHRDLEGVAHD